MGSEDDYYNGCDRPGRKPSLQARLQSGNVVIQHFYKSNATRYFGGIIQNKHRYN